jgi:hypothetical protein
MSLHQTAFLEKSRVPDRARLEEVVRGIGFDLSIDECYQPFESSGFLPCTLKGKASGFEIYFDSTEDVVQSFPHLKEEVGNRDCSITFRWGSDMSECACVLIVSAALAKSFGAVVHYQDDDLLYSAEQLIDDATQAMQHADSESQRRQSTPPQPPKKPWWKAW